ncbi:MAG: hypothetical protein H7832_03805 [Magnetococcus sp. DMHC-6]
MDNVSLTLLDGQGLEMVAGILGKVIEIRSCDPCLFVLHFTFLPPEAEAKLTKKP